MIGPWQRDRDDAESVDLYPGLVVCDGRVTGSITVGRSRLPLWCFMPAVVHEGWPAASDWDAERDGWTAQKAADFVGDLFEMRGEFARLLLVLADAERCDRITQDRKGASDTAWWERRRHRRRVREQLNRCIAALTEVPA